ncbi:glycosyltransferase family 4 protein [Glycomyces rhizosphaerae]|uniref:Glycosyltransferase family 4 protein n=1 Tax=Glycomyces rhizosphaerae TaxID=2054422 RepID=A0ABV7PV06_9ACTN
MEPAQGPARVVMVVPNRIDGDSRVQKAAASIAAAGWETHLIGVSVTGKQEPYEQDGATIHKIPLPKMDPPRSLRRHVAAFRFPFAYSDIERAKRRERHVKAARLELDALRGGGPVRGGVRLPLLVHRAGRRLERAWIGGRARQTKKREKYLGREGRLERIERRWWGALLGDRAWRRLDVNMQRFELAFRPAILALEPDLLHAHDAYSVGVCVRAAEQLRRWGKTVKVVYDAHEFVPGHEGLAPNKLEAQSRWERQYLPGADAVVTVSHPLAKLLQERHGLEREPSVVYNAPLAHPAPRPDPGDLRSDCGLDAHTPLAVYIGWASPERQIEVIVEAARLVPGLHVAFMVSRHTTNPYVKRLQALGEEYGISDRLHFRGYVDYEDLPKFISTADMGIHPMPTGSVNHEIALPNKFFEYCHARLPLVVTTVKTLSAEVRRLGNGEVFTSGDARSLADAIERILADRDGYRRAYKDPALLEEYSWEHQALEYARIYERLIGPAPVPRADPAS